jgi:hypothetical protein
VVSKAAEQIVAERPDCYLAVGSCSSGINFWIIKRDLIDVGTRSLRRWPDEVSAEIPKCGLC